MNKICSKCEQSLSLDCFHKSKSSKDGLQYRCKQCAKQMNAQIKDHTLDLSLQRKYGIDFSEYSQMLDDQSGVCAICSEACVTNKRLSVDHCHTSGKVRGLLCNRCNRAIGLFGDSSRLLKIAANYLERNE